MAAAGLLRTRLRLLPHELLAVHHQPAPTISRLFSSSARVRNGQTTSKPKHHYVTTPIFYVNAAPHIGHLHSTLLADVYSRFSRLQNPDGPAPVFCTGTDEHGLKIQRVAEAQGVTPKELCDQVSERFRDLAQAADMSHTIFIRTTEERHRIAVEHVWRELQARGCIYKSSYSGWYAVSDEAYYPESQVAEFIDPETGEKSMAQTGTKVEWMEEENYKFRLSAFKDQLVEWLSASPSPLQPPSRAAALLASLTHPDSAELQDLSISRPSSRLSWGIPVPDDPNHTIYVWIDALVNYLTAAGYPWKGGEAFEEGQVWPPELQVVGKDIIRFHALYLPAVLLALDLPLPKTLLAHGHWTMDNFKMSKSRGNVADPFEAMKLWGIEPIRLFLMRAGGNSAVDADYSVFELDRFYRKDLASTLGNLLSRISNQKLIARLASPEALYTAPFGVAPSDDKILAALNLMPDQFLTSMNAFEVHRALSSVFELLYECNRYLQEQSPWLATSSPDTVHRSLYYVSDALRMSAIALTPFMPSKSKVLLDSLGVKEEERSWQFVGLGKGGRREVVGKKVVLFPFVKMPEVVEPPAL